MAKITELNVLSVDPNDPETKQWAWKGICPCGQEVGDMEINTEAKMRVNASVTVCSTCNAEAYDYDYDYEEGDND